MKLVRLVLPILLLCAASLAQDVNWTVVLNTATVPPTGQTYLPITSATVNGQPLDVSKGEGVIGPWIYHNSSDYGYIVAQIPPSQPWNPTNSWYQWLPTLANTQRGTPIATQNVMVWNQTDTFTVEYDLTFYNVWPQVWNGSLARTLQLHERCGKWPCRIYIPIDQCIPQKGCYISFTDLSDVLTLTGTFPVPVPPQ